jgi:gamma-glutamylcysteine synthetase
MIPVTRVSFALSKTIQQETAKSSHSKKEARSLDENAIKLVTCGKSPYCSRHAEQLGW